MEWGKNHVSCAELLQSGPLNQLRRLDMYSCMALWIVWHSRIPWGLQLMVRVSTLSVYHVSQKERMKGPKVVYIKEREPSK